MDAEILRKQVMVSQFVNAVGCTPEQATQILQSAQWHFEVSKVNPNAESLFFGRLFVHACKLSCKLSCKSAANLRWDGSS